FGVRYPVPSNYTSWFLLEDGTVQNRATELAGSIDIYWPVPFCRWGLSFLDKDMVFSLVPNKRQAKKDCNYGVTCEDEAKRRNSETKMNTFEENCYLLLYVVSSKEDTAY
ncbi:hypothetical protein Tco_0869503, partial [Tanacetum coccineum]